MRNNLPDGSWVLAPFGLITRRPGLLTRLRMCIWAPCPEENSYSRKASNLFAGLPREDAGLIEMPRVSYRRWLGVRIKFIVGTLAVLGALVARAVSL